MLETAIEPHLNQPQDQYRSENENRKRRPKQLWIANDDPDRQTSNDAFIRDTRRKTSLVFDRISINDVKSADPAR